MPWIRPFAAVVGPLLLLLGFVFANPWTPLQSQQLGDNARWLLPVAVLGWLAGKYLRVPAALSTASIALLPLAYFAGPATLAALALLLIAAMALGEYLRDRLAVAVSMPVALLAGLGALVGGSGWLLPLPLFTPAIVGPVLLLLVWWRREKLLAVCGRGWRSLRQQCEQAPLASLALAWVFALASVPTWLPVLFADDLSYHLHLPAQLVAHGYYRFDVGSQVWAMAPWFSDLGHGLVQVLARSDATGPLNCFWLLVTALLMQRLGHAIGLRGAWPWLAAMLYLSLPLTGGLAMSMQTETASAAFVAALALLVAQAPERPHAGTLMLAAVLAGSLIGMKILNGAFVAPLGLWLLWRWRFALPWRALPTALLLGVGIGGSNYAYAWALAGNPVLPLFNDVFASAWFGPERFLDQHWQHGMHLLLPYRLTFETPNYYEGTAGAAGFVLLGLLGGLVGLFEARARPLLLVALVAWLLPLSQLQYLRYAQPALVLLIPALLLGLSGDAPARLAKATASMLVLLQLAFLSSSSWILANGAVDTLVQDGRDEVLRRFAPERKIAEDFLHRRGDGDRVLIASTSAPFLAPFDGHAFVGNWYDPRTQAQLLSAGDADAGVLAAMRFSGSNHWLLRDSVTTAQQRRFLRAQGAELVDAEGDARLYRLPESLQPGQVDGAESDEISLAFNWNEAGASLASAEVVIACSTPMAPVATGWLLHSAAMPDAAASRYEWLICGVDGKLRIPVVVNATAGFNSLAFNARVVPGGEGNRLSLASHGFIVRPDLRSERDLGRRVRDALCPFARCRPDAPRILLQER